MEVIESLKQTPGMPVVKFANKFCTLGRIVPSIMANEQLKMLKFTWGLSSKIQSKLSNTMISDYDTLFNTSVRIEADIKRFQAEERGERPRLESEGSMVGPKRPSRVFKLVRRNLNTPSRMVTSQSKGKVPTKKEYPT